MTGERHWFLENEFKPSTSRPEIIGGLLSNQLGGSLSIQKWPFDHGHKSFWRAAQSKMGVFVFFSFRVIIPCAFTDFCCPETDLAYTDFFSFG